MSIESCLNYCLGKGFPYAGVEYSVECYCGTTLAAAATQVAETDCNMACSGSATEPCGAGSRLSLFHTTAIVAPGVNPGVNGYNYLGCYSEGTTGRTLTYGAAIVGASTVDKCTAACHTAGYILAGVEYGGECCTWFRNTFEERVESADSRQTAATPLQTAALRRPAAATCSARATAASTAAAVTASTCTTTRTSTTRVSRRPRPPLLLSQRES